MKSEELMRLALEEAKKSSLKDEVPVGCIIMKDDKIIAQTHNLVEVNNDPTNHAEILALKKAYKILNTKNLLGCKIFITLEPCLMCLGAIINSHIKEIYFGALDVNGGAFSFYNVSPSSLEIHFIKTKECEQILSTFFKTKR